MDDDTTTYSASLPILTLTSTTESEVPAETTSVPPVDLPSPIPTGNETSTIVPPVPTGGAAAKNMAGNLIGGVAAGAAVLLM